MEIKGKFGKCIIGDCILGMQQMTDHYELCLTDPPYNIGYDGSHVAHNPDGRLGRNKSSNKDIHLFHEDMSDNEFWNFNIKWFTLALMKCDGVMFTPGLVNLFDWIRFKCPDYNMRIWFKPNSPNFQDMEPFLMYGNIHLRKWPNYIIKQPIATDPIIQRHPCPKQKSVWMEIINKIKPASLFDPFLGSGTTAECAEELGIPWLGFELDPMYAIDIENKIKRGNQRHGDRGMW